MVSTMVSTKQRFWCPLWCPLRRANLREILRRMDNPAHASPSGFRSPWSTGQRAQKGPNQQRLGNSARSCVRPTAACVIGCASAATSRSIPRESTTWDGAKGAARQREAIPNHSEVLERARLKSLELEARKTGITLDSFRTLVHSRPSAPADRTENRGQNLH